MPRKAVKDAVPPSEFRRTYMKLLVSDLQFQYEMTPSQARTTAALMVDYLQDKVFEGKPVDLGFAVLQPHKVKAREYPMNLSGESNKKCFHGEGTRFTLRVHKSWQRKRRPAWSRY